MRLTMSLFAGALVAGLLFLLMHAMIADKSEVAINEQDLTVTPFVRVDRGETVETVDRTLPEPTEERNRPPSTEPVGSRNNPPRETPDRPTFDGLDGIGDGIRVPRADSGGGQRGNGEAQAMVRVEPQWPREALVQGIEGWVRVHFTIRPDGSVSQARVLESHPARVFDRAAVRAIERWRFRPRVADGRAVERTATQVIEFRLNDR